jgi:flagellar protein FlbD
MVRGVFMIRLTRLNHTPVVLNADLIEHIDITPDTVITLTTGQILRVLESADEVVARIVQFRRKIYQLDTEFVDTHGTPSGVEEIGRATPVE